jgi:hypothetical protein
MNAGTERRRGADEGSTNGADDRGVDGGFDDHIRAAKPATGSDTHAWRAGWPGPAETIGVAVVSPKGELLGRIPVPRNLISVAFGGTDKKLLYAVAIRDVEIFSIPTMAQGLKGRPK